MYLLKNKLKRTQKSKLKIVVLDFFYFFIIYERLETIKTSYCLKILFLCCFYMTHQNKMQKENIN